MKIMTILEKYNTQPQIENYPIVPLTKRMDNLYGQRFGRLVALYRTKVPNRKKQNCWLCICDCGNYKPVPISNLKNGSTKSCGCYRKDFISQTKLIDLTGKQYGRLTVIKRDNSFNKTKTVKWICQCECGNRISVSGDHLKKGTTKSCGCLRRELPGITKLTDYTGQRFGKLVVLKRDPENYISPTGKSTVKWICQCDCGNIVSINKDSLRRGYTHSCGCINSYGEYIISQILLKNNIIFEKQKTFETCRFKDTNRLGVFDFYIPNKNYLIEFDGEQHFNVRNNNKGWNTKENFEKVQKRDNFKNQWCKENNIPLIRIPYTHLKDLCIEDLLLETTQYQIK